MKLSLATPSGSLDDRSYRAAFEQTEISMAHVRADGRFLSVNEAFCRLTGYPRQELLTLSFQDLTEDAHLEEGVNAMRQMVAGTRSSYSTEKRYRRKNGELFWLRLATTASRKPDGSFDCFISVFEDINGRKEAEARLQRLNRLYVVLSRVCEAIVHATSPLQLFEAACRIAVEDGLLQMALMVELDAKKSLARTVASWGDTGDYASRLDVRLDEGPFGRGTIGTALRTGRFDVCNDFPQDPRMAPWRDEALLRNYRSTASFPLEVRGVIVGALVLFASETGYFQTDEIDLMVAVARNLSHALESLQDEENRKRAEAAMRESKERYRLLSDKLARILDSSLDVICTFDSEGRFLQTSAASQEIWGYAPAELAGTPYLDKVLPEDRAATLEQSAKIMAGNPVRYFENRYLRKDGTIAHMMWSATWSDTDRSMYCVARDNTERKQSEDRLREQAALLDKAQDAIMVLGLDKRISYWNQSAVRRYGWTAEEALGQSLALLLHKKEASLLELAYEKVIESGEWFGELYPTPKDGRELIIEGRWTLVCDEDGLPCSILVINTDITGQKKLEQQFLRAQRLESLGTLAGGIAHDLNNMLAPIMMAVDLLNLSVSDPKERALLATVACSAKRGSEMVKQVLSFARGVEGRRVTVRLNEAIDDVEKIGRDTFPKNISIVSQMAHDLWTVIGDPTQLHQVLLNLCVNSRDAMSGGGQIRITAENLVLDAQYAAMNIEAKEGPHVVIQVEDTGGGIPADIVERIYDPFFTTKALGQGTGLGLSTSLAIVKSHKGFIRVSSEPGIGTQFQVYLPAEAAPQTGETASLDDDLPYGNGETVLVVDDEASIRQITGKTLEAFGYRVMLASDGVEAVRMFASHRTEIDVVLTDMMMPGMDGPTTIMVLLRMDPEVKIIASSGINTEGSVMGAGSGVRHFIAKPYTASVLLKVLRRVLPCPFQSTDRRGAELSGEFTPAPL